ncbi:MAG: peptidylprolyl isomerase [Promethearchaeota archaeon]
MRASHILVEKFKLAQEICEKLKKGADFAELARTYSICPSKKKGGDLGSFPKGTMVPEFWNACIKLNINEISPPIKTRFGYHVIKRTG